MSPAPLDYNPWKAIAYQVTLNLIEQDQRWSFNPIVTTIQRLWRDDWIGWKVSMEGVKIEHQAEAIKQQWAAEDPPPMPVVIEHPPDNSKAQSWLGGEIEIKAPWMK